MCPTLLDDVVILRLQLRTAKVDKNKINSQGQNGTEFLNSDTRFGLRILENIEKHTQVIFPTTIWGWPKFWAKKINFC